MKQILLFLLFAGNVFSQSMDILDVTAEQTETGLAVTIQSVSYNGAGPVGIGYQVNGNAINIDLCYWFNMTLPVLQFTDQVVIPINDLSGTYTINVTLWNSTSAADCDFYSIADTATTSFLNTDTPDINKPVIYPNPASDHVWVSNDDISYADIYDVSGKHIMRQAVSGSRIELNGMSSGIYLLRLKSEGFETIKKLVVK